VPPRWSRFWGRGRRESGASRRAATSRATRFRAYGTAKYREEGNAWREVAPAGFTPPIVPALETISPPPFSDRLLTELRDLVHASHIGTTPAGGAVIDDELSRSLATIQARLTRLTRGYAIAAGPDRGRYVRFVQALQSTKLSGLTFQALLTAGSVENLSLLHRERVLLGLAQADVAHQALAGQGPFASEGPSPEMRSGQSIPGTAAHHRSGRLAGQNGPGPRAQANQTLVQPDRVPVSRRSVCSMRTAWRAGGVSCRTTSRWSPR
jgi:NMT1-like family